MRFDDLIKKPAKLQKPLSYTESLQAKLTASMGIKPTPKFTALEWAIMEGGGSLEDTKVTELFEPGKSYEWEFRGSEEAHANFQVGNVKYQFIAYSGGTTAGPSRIWEIEFRTAGRNTSADTKFGLTGTGNSAEVMSTVTDIMRDFLKQYNGKISTLIFSAKESSRQGLYAKMVNRLLPNWHLKKEGQTFILTAPEAKLDALQNENFADGKNPQDKGDAKRHGINTKASVSSLRKTAKQGGRKGQLAHWLANMKAGKAKKK
jgi:hypothetical protein